MILAPAAQPAPQPPISTIRLAPYAQLIATRFTAKDGLPAGAITHLTVANGRVLAAGPAGTAVYEAGKWRKAAANETIAAPPALVAAGALPAGAAVQCGQVRRRVGLGRHRPGRLRCQGWPRRADGVPEAVQGSPGDAEHRRAAPPGRCRWRWTCLDRDRPRRASDRRRRLVASARPRRRHALRGRALPQRHAAGRCLGRPTAGAWRLRAGQWRYFNGQRWLPGNRVNAIAAEPSGAVWLATDAGVARIDEKTMTLADKAKHYEEITAARHNRRGWVTSCGLKTPGDPSGGFIYDASDNDGLWTSIYVAAKSFRYAVTKEPEARALAKKSMDAMLDLVRLSGYPGFPARAMIRKGEEITGYDPHETVRIDGEKDLIWYQSPVDANVLVKGDTWSDKLDGHYLAWMLYHDLVADAADGCPLPASRSVRFLFRRIPVVAPG